jgi:hypothetical protein
MTKISTGRDRADVLAMLELKRTVRGPATGPIGEWLVARAKQMWPRFAGISGPRKTSAPHRWNIIAYHHPAQLCWEWFIALSIARRDVTWRHPKHWVRIRNGYGRRSIVIPFLFELSFVTQNYGYMLSSAAEGRLREYALAEEQPS